MANNSQNTGGMGKHHIPKSPFSIRLLEKEHQEPADPSPCQQKHKWLLSLLPATYRRDSDDLVASCHHVAACVNRELDLSRLTNIHSWLWAVGRPMPPRPLHRQLLLGREIFVTERMDQHLVWTTSRMFLKPIPRFLLEPDFWAEYLDCIHEGYNCSLHSTPSRDTMQICEIEDLQQSALGFLFSYAAIISYESDFHIAKEKRLLPPEVNWPAWQIFVEQLSVENIYPHIHPRFHYGELRLSRLNKIYFLSQTPLHGYMNRWDQYGIFLGDNLAWLGSIIVYVAIILTAMQVGLATETLSRNAAFQSASCGFTVFSLLAPLTAGLLMGIVFSCIFIYNWMRTVKYAKKRLGGESPS